MIKRLSLIVLVVFTGISLRAQQILRLEDCRNIVVDSNISIKIAANLMRSAEAKTKATTRDFYPYLEAGGHFKYLATPVSIELGNSLYEGDHNLYQVNAALVQNVYQGGQVKTQTEIARFEQSIAGNTLMLTTDEILFQTEVRYWNATWAKEANGISYKYKTLLDELVKVISDKVEIGLVPKNDLLMTQVKQNEAELLIYKSRMQYAVAIMELNRIIGYDINTAIDVDGSSFYAESMVPVLAGLDTVLTQRPEISIQQDRVNISEKSISLTRSKYMPQVYVSALPTWGSPNTQLLDPNPNFNAALMATVSVPLVHWGKKQFEVSEKRVGYESSLLEMEDLQKQISLELNSTYYQLEEASQRITLTEASLQKADENYKLIEERYLAGLSPIIELLDAQYSWLLAYNSVLDSRLNYYYARASYFRVSGTI
ncbi:MAG: TolC family protein [Bacteroidota bacterium]|nr:MAG: TolC family protein [Bacteroidota bacterium]